MNQNPSPYLTIDELQVHFQRSGLNRERMPIRRAVAARTPVAATRPLPNAPAAPSTARSVTVHDNALDRPYSGLGEQLLAIRSAAFNPYQPDLRLLEINRRGTPAGLSEKVPSDGGFLVHYEFAPQLIERMYQTGEILSRCTEFPITKPNSNGLAIPTLNEQSRANGSRFGGVQSYWDDEADTIADSNPAFGRLQLGSHKLIGLCYLTDELVEDSGALGAFISTAFGQEMSFRLENAIFNSLGVGRPAGIMNSNALIKVPKEIGQASGTIQTPNIVKMWARLWAPSRRNAVWVCNAEAEEQLLTLALPVGSGGSEVPLYKTTDDPERQPYNLMLGRPVIPVEYCPLPGNPGDVAAFDLSRYLLAMRERTNQEVSIHVKFLTGEQAFRFRMRVDGAPVDTQPIIPMNGTVTQSPFVCIDQR